MGNTSKYYGENGIHRVPLWRIGGFALNNTATNLYLMMMGYVSSSLVTMLNLAATNEGVKNYVVWGMGDFTSVTL